MEQDSGAAALPSKPSEQDKAASTSYSPIIIQDLQIGMLTSAPAGAKEAYGRTAQILWKTVAVYTVGGLAYALTLTIPWMVTTGGGFILTRFLWLFACYAWPSVLTLGVILAMDLRESFSVVGGYFAFLLLVALYGMIRNPTLTIGELVYFWLFANAPGTILLLVFLRRRVRAVGQLGAIKLF